MISSDGVHRVRLISRESFQTARKQTRDRELWRCTCGSEFHNEDDADAHAAIANADAAGDK